MIHDCVVVLFGVVVVLGIAVLGCLDVMRITRKPVLYKRVFMYKINTLSDLSTKKAAP